METLPKATLQSLSNILARAKGVTSLKQLQIVQVNIVLSIQSTDGGTRLLEIDGPAMRSARSESEAMLTRPTTFQG